MYAKFPNLREAKENKFPGSLIFKEEMLSFKMISLNIAEYKELLEMSLSHSTGIPTQVTLPLPVYP